ncbi:Uncharacterised protein [[Clostridium] sordellii]|uniref:hypothetical protein n=1 Tax=Paraclostridium sordellii TaxID=1505 RepID=UPI0005E44975|nr:hypothetical protein [Paeniclostridium sordellii]CEN81421.1 Uncharacterised protein [[Clostridium] sordellii] [Paeniclostridium sordellii]CEO09269.1 Uncharacterised protein [[Clostridium] sordellii] [Paeniclostridium sordellii]
MKEILEKVLNDKEENIEEIYSFIDKKIKAISEEESISYSDIAKFVFNINMEDKEYVYRNINKLKSIAKENDNKKMINIMNKIKNHIDLEICRLEYLETKQKQELNNILTNLIGNTTENVLSMKDELSSYSEKIDKHNKEIDNWYTNIITILGLFAAIVVTFFGGLGAISSIFGNINVISKYRLLFIVLLVVFAMFNIVFMALYYIAKISDKSIYKECLNSCKKKSVKNEDSMIKKKIKCKSEKDIFCSKIRYPIIYYFNVVILTMITGSLAMYFFNL